MLLVFVPLKAANNSFMNVCNQSHVRIPKMQDQKSLPHHCRSVSGWGRQRVAFVFATQGSQHLIHGWLQLIATSVTQNATPKIIHAPLMLVFRMGQ